MVDGVVNGQDTVGRNLRAAVCELLSATVPGYAEALASGRPAREVDWDLCAQGLLPEAELIAAYAKASGLPVAEDRDLESAGRLPGLPSSFAAGRCVLPFSHDGSKAKVAICDPYSAGTTAYLLKRTYGIEAEFLLARRSSLERVIAEVYETAKAEAPQLEVDTGSEEALRTLASEGKVVRLVNELFSNAVEMDASDIHVEPSEDRLSIRMRVDGLLHETLSLPLSQYPAIASRIKLLGGMNIAESRLPQDGRTNIQIGRADIDLRISTIPSMDGESVVLRVLRKDAVDFDLAKVGMGEAMKARFERLVSLPHGMILVVGPTGSGKTTTLYSVMKTVNTPDVKIITVEDPVEYRMKGLTQMQVNPKIGLDFANGLRHIVRQDPDVILVGEIRDRETADIAINAALTGHLVFSTLHTNDAAGAISRLIDMGVEGFLISSALCGVLSQRLVRTVCRDCGGSGSAAGSKCRNCSGSGFRGRTGVFELLMVDDAIRAAINKNADSSELAAIARRGGMIPLLDDGRAKVASGVTTEAELARAVSDTL